MDLSTLEFRQIKQEEAEQVAELELLCFPPNEACKPEIMKQRVLLYPELFLVAIEKETGRMVGAINSSSTNERTLRDEFYTDPSLHDPKGAYVMVNGVAVLPEYRLQGIARQMMYHYLRMDSLRNRKAVVLTCVPEKVSMYQKFGYKVSGESDSAWGGEKWYEMIYDLDPTCPACGNYKFPGFDDHTVCHSCGWKNDQSQVENPDREEGDNGMSLNMYRKRLLEWMLL